MENIVLRFPFVTVPAGEPTLPYDTVVTPLDVVVAVFAVIVPPATVLPLRGPMLIRVELAVFAMHLIAPVFMEIVALLALLNAMLIDDIDIAPPGKGVTAMATPSIGR